MCVEEDAQGHARSIMVYGVIYLANDVIAQPPETVRQAIRARGGADMLEHGHTNMLEHGHTLTATLLPRAQEKEEEESARQHEAEWAAEREGLSQMRHTRPGPALTAWNSNHLVSRALRREQEQNESPQNESKSPVPGNMELT